MKSMSWAKMFALLVYGAVATSTAHAGPVPLSDECEKVFVDVTKAFFVETGTQASVEKALNSSGRGGGKSQGDLGQDYVDTDTFVVESVNDLDPGSYEINRKAVISAEIKNSSGGALKNRSQNSRIKLYFTTQGDLFCDGEKVIGLDGFLLLK